MIVTERPIRVAAKGGLTKAFIAFVIKGESPLPEIVHDTYLLDVFD
jgi:hypothetical protein